MSMAATRDLRAGLPRLKVLVKGHGLSMVKAFKEGLGKGRKRRGRKVEGPEAERGMKGGILSRTSIVVSSRVDI